MRMKNNKWLKLVGKILVIISFVFIGRTIWTSRETIAVSLNGRSILVLVCMSCGVVGNIILYAFLYRLLVSVIADKEIQSLQIVRPYVEANLYKYLPGNVMHYVGRNKIAVDGIVTYEQVNVASVIEIVINVFSSAFVGVALSGAYLVKYLTANIQIKWIVAIMVAGVAVVLVGMAFFRRKVLEICKWVFNYRTMKVILIIFSVYSAWNILGNSLLVLLLRTMGGTIPISSILPIIGVSSLSWLMGFMTPGAPGGIGIREAVLHVLLVGLVPTWIIAAAGVLTRLAQIIGEIAAYFIVQVLYGRKSIV